jgi:predicted Rossmann-fold nucleotide-binding protein
LILMGADYWQPLADLLRDPLLAQGTIDAADLSRLLITDDPVVAATAIRDQGVRRFGLRLTAPVMPRWYLGEGRLRRPRG